MAISETARLDMLAGLRTHVGEAVANTLMEHLPPGGWYDVARTSDIDRVREDVSMLRSEVGNLRADIIGLHNRIDGVEARLDDRIDKLDAKFTKQIAELSQKIKTNTKWMIGISLTYGIGILGALVTFMLASLN